VGRDLPAMRRTVKRLACAALGMALSASLQGCSLFRQGTPGGIPPAPALGSPVDRIGRPLTANALLGPLAPDDVSDRRKEVYTAPRRLRSCGHQATLGLMCGNQCASTAMPPRAVPALAKVP
jgi:hypothetical protein